MRQARTRYFADGVSLLCKIVSLLFGLGRKLSISLKNDAFWQARARRFPAFFQNFPAFPKLQGETPKISDFIDTRT
jgi:hypothetical protein